MRYRNDGRANLRMRCVLLLLALLVAAADAGSSKADKYKRLPKATPAPDTGSQHGDHEEHPMFADNVYELESRARAGALMHAHHASVFGLFRERHGAAARVRDASVGIYAKFRRPYPSAQQEGCHRNSSTKMGRAV